MRYRNIATLSSQLAQWWGQLPQDIELIVGIPWSGLLVANLLALFRNLPVADVEGLLEGRVLRAGRRGSHIDSHTFLNQPRNVLVLDDSIGSGRSFSPVRERIESAQLPHRIHYAVVYVTPDCTQEVDFFCEILPQPHAFEWNLLHHPVLRSACVDIDGVLCRNPTPEEDDDGPAYERFLREVLPLCVPLEPIGCLVTSRLEKYRAHTEDWLSRHGITYQRLAMLPLEDKATRAAFSPQAAFKAAIFREMGEQLFIESSFQQAQEIAYLSRGPVLCIQTQEVYTYESLRENPLPLGVLRTCAWHLSTQNAIWGTLVPQATAWHLFPQHRGGGDWVKQSGYMNGLRLAFQEAPRNPAWQGLHRWMVRTYVENLLRYLGSWWSKDPAQRQKAKREFHWIRGAIRGARLAKKYNFPRIRAMDT